MTATPSAKAALSHTDVLAQIPAARRAALQERSDWHGLRHLVLYLSAMGILATWVAMKAPLWPLAMLPLGILWVFLFTLSHECTHDTPFKTRWLNRAVGHACALPLVLPFTWFRAFHMAHHKFTNDPDNDPELAGSAKPETWARYLGHLSGWSYWQSAASTLVHQATGRGAARYIPQRKLAAVQREARLMLCAYALVGASLLISPLALWLWVVPSLLGQPFLRAYLLAEHGRCPPVANMLENSRTTYTNRLIRMLAWNMPYHAEHHAFPNVPFHQLPALHEDVKAHLQSTSNGYAAFHKDYQSSLR